MMLIVLIYTSLVTSEVEYLFMLIGHVCLYFVAALSFPIFPLGHKIFFPNWNLLSSI